MKLTFWVLLLATAAIAIHGTQPPRALDETAPAEQFSAARAKTHLAQIAREPHPIGTAANHRVRDYLIGQLTSLGAEVQLERGVGTTNSGRHIAAGTAENIVATVRGSASGRAVMLASHYDSVPQGPGAADAGAGVVALLEVIRALNASPRLKNDVVILYTDGEEDGLVGAAAFVQDRPDLAQRIGVVMNFEARGTSGPALLFETSERNGWLTREFARAAAVPVGSSLAYAVYKRMPNDTDMTVFKKAGLMGLNFAFTGSFENYHTARDTPENLDARSLQHLGSNALALTRHFGNLDLQGTREADRVYFNWYGSWLIDYSQWVVWLILAASFALLVATLAIAARRRTLTPLRTLLGVLGSAVVVGTAAGGAHLVWWLIPASRADRLLSGDTWSNALIVLGCVVAGLAFAVAVQTWLARRFGADNLIAGQLLAFAAATAAITCLSPDASYVFQWPLLFALLGLLGASMFRNSAPLLFLAAVPAVLIFAPLAYQLFVILGLNTISVVVLGLLLGLLVVVSGALLPRISGRLTISVPFLFLCSTALVVSGLHLSRFSPEHPRRNSVFYSVNADAQEAAWLSNDAQVDDWTSQFLTRTPTRGPAAAFTFGGSRAVFSAEAELVSLEPPAAIVISDNVGSGQRSLTLRLTTPRNAPTLIMRLASNVTLRAVKVNGRSLDMKATDAAGVPWTLRYNAPPPEGVELQLELASEAPFGCWLADRSYGLPNMTGYTPRPPDMMPAYGSDVVLVGREYTF